ncbi:ribonuclease domain-containing protein [Serinicoccus kebangsaanensis]|uniref:ribonuclease domain-containing protein n=1 Tax=Serinicoccus kebangsaanensis TaxID=2602069 RepID=UPI001EE34C46|nr:ribonuclease domain-containing protein [Serinicoccus kebangsaanensis]
MRLSRPVATGLLVLCAAIVLWLMVGQGGQGTDDAAAPTGQGTPGGSTSEDTTFGSMTEDSGEEQSGSGVDAPEPTQESDPAADADQGDPVGVDTRDWDDVDACAEGMLPDELDPVVDDIEVGGPYDYGRDGITFENREGFLPDESFGYYQEFTVETPGLDHRGAKRVVTGGGEVDPEVWYYTEDHYQSFCEFAPAG